MKTVNKPTRPNCRQCGKPLRKHTYQYQLNEGEPDPTEAYGQTVIAILGRRIPAWAGTKIVGQFLSLWFGDWGLDGNGHFCSKHCGYTWALEHVDQEAATHGTELAG